VNNLTTKSSKSFFALASSTLAHLTLAIRSPLNEIHEDFELYLDTLCKLAGFCDDIVGNELISGRFIIERLYKFHFPNDEQDGRVVEQGYKIALLSRRKYVRKLNLARSSLYEDSLTKLRQCANNRGEIRRGANRRANDAITSGKNPTRSYFSTRYNFTITTAVILTHHPNPFRDSLRSSQLTSPNSESMLTMRS